jgi:hypothetical protein
MPNANDEITDVLEDGSQPVSPQDPQLDANPPAPNTTGNSDTTVQPPNEMDALRLENERLKGQARSVQKKYLEAVRKGTQVPASTPNGEPDGTEVFNAAMELSEAKLRNRLETEIFPYYDGTHPDAKDMPTLPSSEFARVRKNPWAFAARESLMHAMKTGDLQPALLDIEQAMADRVEEIGTATNPKPTLKGAGMKQVNPSPAPVGSQGQQPQGQDLWTMPMDQLESLNSKVVQTLSAK